MFMNKFGKYPLAIAIALILAFTIGSPVKAEELDSSATVKTLADLTSKSKGVATSVLSNLGKTELVSGGSFNVTARNMGVSISLPNRSSDLIRFESGKGDTIGVGLPFGAIDSTATTLKAGLIAYGNRNSTVTVPIIKDDGSLQLTTMLNAVAAPEKFEYKFTLPQGSKILPMGQGLAFMNGNRFIGGLAEPWAKDAEGRDVPTRYEVSGNIVNQIIEHRASKFAYPIVADPWLGLNIFSSVTIGDKPQGGLPVVNLNLSTWGWSVYFGLSQGGGVLGFAAGQAILVTAGWDEAWGKGGAIQQALNKPSQREQFECHALGALTASDWNLEKFRLNRLNGNWRTGVLVHHCNWKTADGY
jgi:hypothetical protein